MQRAMRDAIVLARNGARNRGVERLGAELRANGIRDVAVSIADEEFARDWIRASRLSRSYAARWLNKATTLMNPRAASTATRGSLERIAVSESSEAFTSGRTSALSNAPPRLVSELRVMRVWDAELDRRTCPTCAAADGTMVGANEPFPLGEPGSLHPFDRCGFSLVTVNFRGTPR